MSFSIELFSFWLCYVLNKQDKTCEKYKLFVNVILICTMSGGNAAPITATDSLSQAVKANIIPNQEYLLQVNQFMFSILYFINYQSFNVILAFFVGFGIGFSC